MVNISLCSRTALATFLCALFLVSSCHNNIELPELPIVSTEGVIKDVRKQFESSRARVDRKPTDATLNGRYGLVMAAYGRDQAADIAFLRARLLAPEKPRWYFYHGFVLRRLGQTERALEAIEGGLSAKPNQTDLLVKRGELFFEMARFEDARNDLLQALEQNPNYPLADYYLARIESQLGNWSEAIARLKALLDRGVDVKEVQFHLASAYRATGELEKAAIHLQQAESNDNVKILGYDPVIMKLAEFNLGDQPHVVRAAELYRRGKVTEALAELNIAHEKNPNNVGTHVHLVRFYGHSGNLAKAKEHYEQAIALDPNFSQSHSNMGFAYQLAKDYTNSSVYYQKAIEQNPNDAGSHAELGLALIQTGQLDTAVKHFEASLELQPVNRDLRYFLGEAYLQQRRVPESIAMLVSALNPEDQKTAAVLRSLAKAHIISSNKESAIEVLQRAQNIAVSYSNTELANALGAELEQVKFMGSAQ